MDSIFLADLTTEEAGAALASERTVVALLPVGAVEAHGPHAPLGTDTLISSQVAERAARALAGDPRVHALVLPPVAWGVTRFARGFAGTLSISAETLTALLLDLGTALVGEGIRHLAIVNSHFEPAHVATLRGAVAALGERGARAGLLELTRRRLAQRLTEEFKRGSCHAGQYETSLVLAARPELIDGARARALPALEVDMPGRMGAGADSFETLGMAAAYCGDPAAATAAEGETTYATLTTLLLELVAELVGEPG
jgi:creatinine amidohydrolase